MLAGDGSGSEPIDFDDLLSDTDLDSESDDDKRPGRSTRPACTAEVKRVMKAAAEKLLNKRKQAMQEAARTMMWEEEIAEEDCEAYLLKFMESGEPIERRTCRSQRTFECPGTHSEPSLTQCLPPSQCR